MANFNETHPELRKGEIFLMNMDAEPEAREFVGDFAWTPRPNVGYKSRRVGHIGYDIHGVRVPGLLPVFVSKKEYEAHQKTRAAANRK